MNKQQLAAKIWESANQMRSKIEANEYKDYILGFIFYKYLSDKEVQFLKGSDIPEEAFKDTVKEEDAELVEYVKTNLGYFIDYKNLFSTWIGMGKDFDVANVRDALSAFSRLINPLHKKLFDRVFNTLDTGLTKLGDSSASQTKAIRDLLHLIKDIPMDGKQDYDVLGFIYEYLISMFAANAGKKAGEFYTPHEVSLMMSEIVADHLKDRREIQIYDPTSGSGSLLINIGKSVAKHIDQENNIKYYAQELKENTYNLTRMNLVMRGILPNNIVTRNGDTLEDDWPYFDESDPQNSYEPLYVDAVVSNPPYSQQWDPSHKETDPRYSRFGLAPKSKADYAFLLHDLFHLKPDGIMAIVLPHGVLFRGGEEGQIRQRLIEENHVDTIIGLPAGIFFGTGIPTIVMILKQKRENTNVLIVDASKGFVKDGKNNRLRACDIKRITDTVLSRSEVAKYSKLVEREEIRTNEYNLNIPRYVDTAEGSENWDIYASMFGGVPVAEIDQLHEYWSALPGLREALFENNMATNARVRAGNITEAIKEHEAVKAFATSFEDAMGGFDLFLKSELIDGVEKVNLNKEKVKLSDEIFGRLAGVPLIDKYEAYQLLDNEWNEIKVDIEIVQSEGFDATKRVDPNFVVKKKKGVDTEVQEGWKGHIFPFELVQREFLTDELNAVTKKENRLAEIAAEYEELLDMLSEEAKEGSITNEAKDAFVAGEVAKAAKEIRAEMKRGAVYGDDDDEPKIVKVAELMAEEKELKKQVREEGEKLHLLTKARIEALTSDEVNNLLEHKWITPLMDALHSMPGEVINLLTRKVNHLAEKYGTTLKEVSQQLTATERELATMMGELSGSSYDMEGISQWQKLLMGE